ncbi:uncharacterized protein LOC141902620 [Tubulanus polymorphus]|uniref:uncharacterized protein LOC141902620 n=1 Tax=Tubulanus polymorphus TaxID=672921 RepID=UPI003DA60A76
MKYISPVCVVLALALFVPAVLSWECYFKICKNGDCSGSMNTKCLTDGPCYKQIGDVDGISWEMKGCYSPYEKCNEGNVTYTGGLKLTQLCCSGDYCNSAEKSTLALSSIVFVASTFVIRQFL